MKMINLLMYLLNYKYKFYKETQNLKLVKY